VLLDVFFEKIQKNSVLFLIMHLPEEKKILSLHPLSELTPKGC
jgi:hypothetical protein